MAPSPYVRDVSPQRFDADVLQRSHQVPVVVDFWAPWCGPCRTLGPILEQLATRGEGRWELAKINSDHAQDLARRYGVQGIPAVYAFVDGEVVAQFVGVKPPDAIQRWLDGFLPDEADLAAQQGDTHQQQGRLDEASAAYQEAMDLDPANARARLGLAEIALARQQPDTAKQWIARLTDLPPALKARRARIDLRLEGTGDLATLRAAVEAQPDNLDARWSLAHGLAAADAWTDALAQLLAIVSRDRAWRDDQARRRLLEWFGLLGNDHPAVRDARRQLANLLY